MTNKLLRDVFAQTKVMFNEDHPLNKQLREVLAQPEKEWVGLTDEEMMQSYIALKSVAGFYSLEKYARDIEARLKEKNT